MRKGLANPNSIQALKEMKMEIAKELGVYDTVQSDNGWGNVSSRNCGNIVKKALEMRLKGDI